MLFPVKPGIRQFVYVVKVAAMKLPIINRINIGIHIQYISRVKVELTSTLSFTIDRYAARSFGGNLIRCLDV
jgi:hypothetical protein